MTRIGDDSNDDILTVRIGDGRRDSLRCDHIDAYVETCLRIRYVPEKNLKRGQFPWVVRRNPDIDAARLFCTKFRHRFVGLLEKASVGKEQDLDGRSVSGSLPATLLRLLWRVGFVLQAAIQTIDAVESSNCERGGENRREYAGSIASRHLACASYVRHTAQSQSQ